MLHEVDVWEGGTSIKCLVGWLRTQHGLVGIESRPSGIVTLEINRGGRIYQRRWFTVTNRRTIVHLARRFAKDMFGTT